MTVSPETFLLCIISLLCMNDIWLLYSTSLICPGDFLFCGFHQF